jgi:hypothetical protein
MTEITFWIQSNGNRDEGERQKHQGKWREILDFASNKKIAYKGGLNGQHLTTKSQKHHRPAFIKYLLTSFFINLHDHEQPQIFF